MPEQEVLLRVEHLCQYFKSTKAVDDVSFDIKKGEVIHNHNDEFDARGVDYAFGADCHPVELLPPEQQPYVLLCGIESHICVLQTAMDLKAHGYQPYLVGDCLSSRKPADHRMALERAKQEGILLTTCEATLFELLAAAGTPDSKAIQKLIK